MKKTILMLAALAPFAAILAADKPEKSPEEESAEKAVRVRAMATAYAPCTVNVRFRLKRLPDGSFPDTKMQYRCPACGNSALHLSRDNDDDLPCLVTGFVIAPNRALVQDLALRADWLDGLEVVCGTNATPARLVACYPDENAVLLETDRPLAGVRPLAFTGDATNKPSLFHLVTDADGRVKVGLRKVNREFTHYPATGEDWCGATPNTLVVDASNRAVSVQMRLERKLNDVLPKPPSSWRSEPFAEREARIAALEKRVLASILPVYLHIDEEKGGNSGRLFMFSDESKSSGDVDTFGIALEDGDVLIPLNLDSGKIAALDKMEATLPDGKKVPLEFAGAFAEYGLFLLRFPDGKTPAGVASTRFSAAEPEKLMRQAAYLVQPKNRNGKIQISLAPRAISGFRRVRGGAVVPNEAPEPNGLLLLASGEVAALGGHVRSGGESWRSRTAIPGDRLARLVAARDFDPEFSVRKGKDRIRVAWIGVETQAMTKELAREKNAQGYLSADIGRGSLVGKVYTNTPAARVGIKEGDVLLWARRTSSERREKLETRDREFGIDIESLFENLPPSMFDRVNVTPWPKVEEGVNDVFTRMGIGTKVVIAWVSNGEKREA